VEESDEAAFRTLVATRGDALARTAYLLTGDWQRAEDLVQTALVTTWTHWSSLRDAGAAEAYARRCMARTNASWWRRRWTGEVPTGALPDTATSEPHDAVDVAVPVLRALAALTRRQRAAVVLRYFDDLSEAAVADVLGCSVGTVKSTVARALELLRAQDVWDGLRAPERTTP
jgi:RNA polymerase sigma-70 factor (sigma-E family)